MTPPRHSGSSDDGDPAEAVEDDRPGTAVATEDDASWPRWARLGLACVVALAVGVFLASARDSNGASNPAADPSPTLGDGTLPTGHPSLDGSDQYQDFTLAQLESDAADESAPVALRLTLAERYLATGDIQDARRQARLALAQSGTDVEQQRSLRDLGWAAALSGDSERGAALLQQALEVLPGERNATWYLANVRLAGLNDPAGAADLFRELLTADDLGADQRSLIEARLAEAEAAAGTGPAPTSTPAAN